MNSLVDLQIRAELPGDAAGISAVHSAAFRREEESHLVERLRQSSGFDAGLSLVAVAGDMIVGHILFTPITIERQDEETGAATSAPATALAPLAVLPEHQRKGIGGALIRAGLNACRERKHRMIIVLGHPRYYPRFGFVAAGPLGITCPFPVPPETFMALDLLPERGPTPTGRVEYPPPFRGEAS